MRASTGEKIEKETKEGRTDPVAGTDRRRTSVATRWSWCSLQMQEPLGSCQDEPEEAEVSNERVCPPPPSLSNEDSLLKSLRPRLPGIIQRLHFQIDCSSNQPNQKPEDQPSRVEPSETKVEVECSPSSSPVPFPTNPRDHAARRSWSLLIPSKGIFWKARVTRRTYCPSGERRSCEEMKARATEGKVIRSGG